MRTARWTAGIFVLALAGILGLKLARAPEGEPGDPLTPDQGLLPPLLEPPPRDSLFFSFRPEAGEVVSLAVDGDRLFLLAREGWALASGDTLRGWFGSSTPGDPEWLHRPVEIAAASGAVYILEGNRQVVSLWDTLGTRLGEMRIPGSGDLGQRPTSLHLPGPSGSEPLVVVQRLNGQEPGSWDLVRLSPDQPARILVSRAGSEGDFIYREPRITVGRGGVFWGESLTAEIFRVDQGGGVLTPAAVRRDPPRWRVPPGLRREHEKLLATLPGPVARISHLPTFWPILRDLGVRGDGSFLLAYSAAEDWMHLELLAPTGEPQGRLTQEALADPVFFSRGRVFLVREGPDRTRIHELVF